MSVMRPGHILLIDLDACVRCFACEVACREEHGLDVKTGSRWLRVMTVGPRRCGGELHLDFVPTLCLHCQDPACREVCPGEAISALDDGTVAVDEAQCTGCRQCVDACPYGSMSFNEVTGVAGHCDLCRDRVSAGLEPACVQHCIGGALQWLAPDELARATSGAHTSLWGRVCYMSTTWRLATKT
jgi:Fe-S-cluster-containing dehydrogenase component